MTRRDGRFLALMVAALKILRPRAHIAYLVSVCVALLAAPLAQATPPPKHNPPKSVYLALGDSVAFGFQRATSLQTHDPAAFNTGYVDDFAKDLRAIRPNIQTVNLACPGEWTNSLLGLAACPYQFALHTDYSGSQIDAGLAVLHAHPGQVSPITITIGGVTDLRNGNSLDQIQANLSTILGRLRQAAPYTEIIVVGYYNPLAATAPGTDIVVRLLNDRLAQAAAQYRAEFADPLPVFNPAVNEIPTICSLTLFCTPLQDIHPSDLGYQKLADLLLTASGY